MIHKIVKQQFISKNCFVCGIENDFGLKARFYETEGKELISVCHPSKFHQSYPSTMHGGVASAILDETIGRAICVHHGDMVWGVTIELKVKFRKPVPYGEPVRAIARITNDRGRLFEGTGEIILANGDVAVSAEGLYMKRQIQDLAGGAFVGDEWGFTPEEEMPTEIEL